MSQTMELNPAGVRRVYPSPVVVEKRPLAESETETVYPSEFVWSGDMRISHSEKQENAGFQPDVIGTIAVATASFALAGGLPFGLVGFIGGGVVGLLIGVINQRKHFF